MLKEFGNLTYNILYYSQILLCAMSDTLLYLYQYRMAKQLQLIPVISKIFKLEYLDAQLTA